MDEDKQYVIKSMSIKEGSKGFTYQKVFCEHLEGAKKVEIREPYLRNEHQFGNLKKFIELLNEQNNGVSIDLITNHSHGHERDYTKEQQHKRIKLFSSLMKRQGITFQYDFDKSSHVRRITSDHNKMIKSDRGLHIYKELQDYDGEDNFAQRICKFTEIDYIEPMELVSINDSTNYSHIDFVAPALGDSELPLISSDSGYDNNKRIIIDNITVNDAQRKKIRILNRNIHLFPQEIQGQRKSYILPLRYSDVKYDFKYIIGSDDGRSRSGIMRLGADFYDYIGIEEGTKLSIELKDEGVYEIYKMEEGAFDYDQKNNHTSGNNKDY